MDEGEKWTGPPGRETNEPDGFPAAGAGAPSGSQPSGSPLEDSPAWIDPHQQVPGTFDPENHVARRSESGLRRFMISILLVVTVGTAAYLLSRRAPPAERQNLIDLTVMTDDVAADLVSRDVENIERYIREAFGVKIDVPSVQDAEITGIGALEARRGVLIPTILVDDPSGDVNRIYVFTYSLLDRWARGVYLERAVRVELENPGLKTVVTTEDDREAVLWRSGDDIFVAVAEQGASRLIHRIRS